MFAFRLELDWEAENKLLEQVMSGNLSYEAKPLILSDILHTVNVTAPQSKCRQVGVAHEHR